MVLLSSNVCAQSSLKLKARQNPLTTSNTEPVKIIIRCAATKLNTEPLFIIDGVVAKAADLRNIDPNNIDSIWILKGHTATALYGCRAVDGVIIITTKAANNRTIRVKDMLTGEILARANVDLIPIGERRDAIHLITDSSGKIMTDKIVSGKEYELEASNVGYKNFRCIVNAKQVGRNYNVLLERNYKDLEEVKIKSSVMKSVQGRNNQAYFEGLYGSIRCLAVGVNVINSYQMNIEERKSMDNIKLYPNPALRNQKVQIEFVSGGNDKLTIKLFSLDGKQVGSSEYQVKKDATRISYMPNGDLTAGIYVLQIIDEKRRVIKTDKLIIQ